MKSSHVAFLFGLSVMAGALTASAAPQKAAEITVSGYTGASTLENFPVLVRISEAGISGFSYADCASEGADISFKDASGTTLDFDIDTWDTSGTSLVWVKVPALSGDATKIDALYATGLVPRKVTATEVTDANAASFSAGTLSAEGGVNVNYSASYPCWSGTAGSIWWLRAPAEGTKIILQ